MRRLFYFGFVAIAFAKPIASSASPREIETVAQLPPGFGAVRMSIRSQIQLTDGIFVWFAPVIGASENDANAFPVGRRAGVPIAGTNMIDNLPKVFAVPPGRYKLIAYTVKCHGLPPIGTTCTAFGRPLPTQRYSGASVEFQVEDGKLTDAGEYVLELPSDLDVGYSVTPRQAFKAYSKLSVRWRQIAALVPSAFATMPASPPPSVAASMVSAIRCEQKPAGIKGMKGVCPFHC